MPLNWGLELVKWKFLSSKLENSTWQNAYHAVFAGISLGMFTPNRLGEYPARVMLLKEENRFKGLLLAVLGSLSQTFITVFAALIALVFYYQQQKISWWLYLGIIGTCTALLFLITLLFFNLHKIAYSISKKRKSKYWLQLCKVCLGFSHFQIFKLLLFSLGRYLVFSSQFLLALYLAGAHFSAFEAWERCCLIFFSTSVLPSFAIAELGIRSSVSIFFLSDIISQSNTIVLGASLLWLLNLIVPAILGVVSIFYFKIQD